MNICITGVTGSLGSALVARWYGQHKITGISRDQHKQAEMQRQYPDVQLVTLDIANAENYARMKRVFSNQHALIHTAALKIVSQGESQPEEVTMVNVVGSRRVVEAWYETGPQRPAIGISSDKAVNPINHYGKSKGVMETLFRVSNYDYDPGFSVVRYGNVVTSRGSFLNVWKAAIDREEPIMVVKQPATRFFMTMNDATSFIHEVLEYLVGGGKNGIFVPMGLRAFSVHDVVKAVLDNIVTHAYPINWIDIGPYEKLHESLLEEGTGVERVSYYGWGRVFSPHWPADNAKTRHFHSNLAPRMTGAEVLEFAGWEVGE